MENSLEGALSAIQERNKRVEADKAWETSCIRRGFIAVMTYIVATLYMYFGLGNMDAWLHAFVPTGGYLLSTFSLPMIKKAWIQKHFGADA